MDFYKIRTRILKNGITEIYPDFQIVWSKDIMFRGKSFYAIWDEERQLWSTNEFDVQRLVDKELAEYREKYFGKGDETVIVKYMKDASSNSWYQYRKITANVMDTSSNLDEALTFLNTPVKKSDHVSKRLPYPLEPGTHAAWDQLLDTLYGPEERIKIEWAIGAIVAGEAKNIQKFIVLYGESGAGKSTVLNIIQKLFQGYYTTFESKALGASNNTFSTEMFRGNPLVAIEHDGDLSRIEDNTKLNSIVAHEEMTMNEKFKSGYTSRANCFLFIGTNKPVKITDGKSGIIRRLIDVRTTGNIIPSGIYWTLMSQVEFELGAIAHHCMTVYRECGKNYFSGYKPVDMMLQTDVFYNFVEANYYTFRQQNQISLAQAWDMYKTYCDEALIEHKLPKHKFRDELKNYFKSFSDRGKAGDNKNARNIYSDFIVEKFVSTKEEVKEIPLSLVLDSDTSIFDDLCQDNPAQYANNAQETPLKKWANVSTTLKELNTGLLHYVKLPSEHIVIDFDIKDDNGEKSLKANLEAANKWPPTYAEFSKSRKGIHLHYIYDGDPDKLSRVYSDGIEIKVFNGDASLRRLHTKSNNVPIAHINSGLPLKGEKVIDAKTVASERGLRDLVLRNLHKEIHPGTKPSIDFIYKILEDAYNSGMKYDLTEMRQKVLTFAINSSHQQEYCVSLVGKMKFKSEHTEEGVKTDNPAETDLIFFDVEVFPNLFIVCWKYKGKDKQPVRMINPTPSEIEGLIEHNLVGFNCRRYDNHILYARYIGYDNKDLFDLSSKIVGGSSNAYFREAYNISYADIYDFSSVKKSLKAFQIDLGIKHQELGLPWNEPIPEDKWHLAAEYCENDVISSEAVFEDRRQDFTARQILSELSGLSINDTTRMHTEKIMFGNDPAPQTKFVYTDLSITFPGYSYENGKSFYKGQDPGEGGYVYAEPGMYRNVALLDVASMHPSSILAMNMFGPYTKRYEELLSARLAIKHKDYSSAKKMLGGMLSKYLDDPEQADALAYALKIHALNIVYGLTAARFDNKFKDPRNVDNIVAKRGALFMIDLKEAVESRGYKVAHIKTDSIKIPEATPEIIEFVHKFGAGYGYTFEHEATYSDFCLVNNAVYIARYKDGKNAGKWTATGAEFAQPYVFKTLFSKEPIEFRDLCEAKAVTSPSAIYLDTNEKMKEDEHNYQFIGKVGLFCPVVKGAGGGILYRFKEGKYYAITGTKGYRWLESEVVSTLGLENKIDMSYYKTMLSNAIDHISEFGDFNTFISEKN